MNRKKIIGMTMSSFILNGGVVFLLLLGSVQTLAEADHVTPKPLVLKTESFRHYIDTFNQYDNELYVQQVPNAEAWTFIENNVPLLECPDKEIEEIYYFRWWTFRKHIKKTPDGFVITEFLPKVGWAGKHNTINCPAGHHIREGRWILDPKFIDNYATFWLRKGGSVRHYSFWIADSVWQRYCVTGNPAEALDLLPDLVKNYEEWEKEKLDPNGLFWQIDGYDGMEVSIGGSGYRATINTYQYGDARAIARIAEMADKPVIVREFNAKADKLKALVQEKLWDADTAFFKVLPRGAGKTLVDVRELHGLTPWYCNLPDADKAIAWKQLMDPQGFYAPFGPTSAEQRHPRFAVSYTGHECQWNGPSWPFATSITLTGLANLLNTDQQEFIGKKDYYEVLKIYTKSQHRKLDDGRMVPWLDENLNPTNGDWISRTRLKSWNNGTWDAGKGGVERGKDYNHSTYCDLVISGLIGLRPRADGILEINPLVPEGTWDYFCLDQVRYHGRWLTILYDKTGEHYKRGKGLRVFADGQEIACEPTLSKITVNLVR